jgi:proteic killer suppression protein
MIHNFLTVGTEDIFNGNSTKSARKTLPPSLWRVAARNLDQLDSVQSLEELKVPPGNRLELLSGDRNGQWRIRINDQSESKLLRIPNILTVNSCNTSISNSSKVSSIAHRPSLKVII